MVSSSCCDEEREKRNGEGGRVGRADGGSRREELKRTSRREVDVEGAIFVLRGRNKSVPGLTEVEGVFA